MERWREFYVPPKSNTPWTLGGESLKKSPMSKIDRHFKTTEYGRSRHQSRHNYPPSPSVEDENVSLAREHLSVLHCSDPPHRGSIDQNPIIIEVNVTRKKSCNFPEAPNSKEKSKRMKNTDKNTKSSKSHDKDAGIQNEKPRSIPGQTSARHIKSDHKKLPALSISGPAEGDFSYQRGDLSPVTNPRVKEPNISSQRGRSSPVVHSKPQDSTHTSWQMKPPLATKSQAVDSNLPSQRRDLSPVSNSRAPDHTHPSRQKDPLLVAHSKIQDSTLPSRRGDSSPVTNSRAPDYTLPSRQKDPLPVAHSKIQDSTLPSRRGDSSPVTNSRAPDYTLPSRQKDPLLVAHSKIQDSTLPSRRGDSSPVTNSRAPDYTLPSRQKDPLPVAHSKIQDSTLPSRRGDFSPVTNSRAPDYTLPSRQKDPSPVAHSRTQDSAFPSQRREISPVPHSRIQDPATTSRRADSSPLTDPRVQDSNFPSRRARSPKIRPKSPEYTLSSRRKESPPITNSRVQGSNFSFRRRESSPIAGNKVPDYTLPSRRREPSPVINPVIPDSTIPSRRRDSSPVSHSRTHDSIPPSRRRETSPIAYSRAQDSIPSSRRRETSPTAHSKAQDSHFNHRRKDSSPVNNPKASDSIFPSRRRDPSPVAHIKSQDTYVQSRRRESSPISHSRIQDSTPQFRQGDSQAATRPKAQESTHINRRRETSPMSHRLQESALKVVNSCKSDQKHWNNPSNYPRSGKNTPPESTPETSEKHHSRRRTGAHVPEKQQSRRNSQSPPGNRGPKVQIVETCETRGRRIQNEHIRQRQPSENSTTSRAERCTSTHSVRFAHDVDIDQQHNRGYDVSSDEDNSNCVEITKISRYRPQNRIKQGSQHRSSSKSIKTLRDTKSVSRLNSPLSSPSAPSSPAFMKERTYQLPAWKLKQKFQNDSSRSPSPFSPERQVYRADKRSPVTTLKMRHLRSPVSDRFETQTEASKRGITSFEKVLTQPLSQYLPPSLQPVATGYPFEHFWQSPENFDHKYTIPVPLPPCPRMEFIEGRNDWLTLPHCPNFDVCPSCFDMSIAPTEFNQFFVPSPRNEPGVRVLCDFGKSPWFRIAWLMIITENLGSLDLFHELANIAETLPECLGEHETVRQWCSIINTRTGTPIRGFKVCLTCVKNVEILLPVLHGMFVYLDSYNAESGICALRSNSRRFVQYFDELEKIAVEANTEGVPPDPHSLERLALHFDTFEECQMDTELFDTHWHLIPQLPEFTVCRECFNTVVWPLLEEGRDIPKMFSDDIHLVSQASCQLYSPYMRDAFLLAVTHNDYWMLASIARQRREAELAFKADNMGLRRMKHIGWEAENEPGSMEVWKSWE